MAYIGQSLVEGTRRVYNYTASSGQTTFDAVYQVGVVDVYKNGVLLTPSSYTSSNGQQIVLNSGASAGDTIAIHCHNTFSVTDTVPATGGAFSGAVTVQGAFTSLGIDDNADATAITIDSSERVGIGVTAPATTVHLKAASANLRIEDSDTSAYGQLGVDNAGSVYLQADNANAQSSTNMYFSIDNSEKMRIDSSGRLMIGTTTEGNPAAENLTISDSGHAGMTIRSTDNTSSRIYFSDATSGTGEYIGYFIYDHSTNALHIATNGNERMQIDASGNVGIGNSSMSSYYSDRLVVGVGDEDGMTIVGSPTHQNYIMFADGTSGDARYKGYISYDHNVDTMKLASNGATRLQIDSAGNVIIGTDSASFNNTSKTVIRSGTGSDNWTIKSAVAHAFNRTGSDGDILEFYRTSSTKTGSIGAENGDLHIDGGSGHVGIRFQASSILPRYNDADTNGTMDLGYDDGSSRHRWRNLYLSDGVYFGTNTSNKLNAYETGSWTPNITATSGSTSASLTAVDARYVRVGDLLNCTAYIHTIDFSQITNGAYVIINGLPFANNVDYYAPIVLGHNNTNIAGGYVENNGTVYLSNSSGTEFQQQNNDITGNRFMFQCIVNLNI